MKDFIIDLWDDLMREPDRLFLFIPMVLGIMVLIFSIIYFIIYFTFLPFEYKACSEKLSENCSCRTVRMLSKACLFESLPVCKDARMEVMRMICEHD